MNTTEQRNSAANDIKDPRNQNLNAGDRNSVVSEEFYDNDELKQTNEEIAERGYTIRNGYDPNKPNPDEDITNDEDEHITNDEDDLDDLNDDFHTDRDLEPDNLDTEIDIDGDEKVINDEFDNPSDDFGETFNETEEDLEDIDQDDDEDIEDDELEYEENDIEEEDYPANDPRKF